ncbi:MAG: hypothetical protein FVQ80_11350 [Planctomycetes bacterium]|nr:hypothetical protein [Planctomycetota bacterium]
MSKTKKSSKKKTRVKKTKKATYRKGSLGNAIREYFDSVGVDEADYDKSREIALSIMPQSKYSKSHFSWYKNDYRKRAEILASTKKSKKKSK